MKEFLQLMRRFVSPYKRYIGWAIVLNVLSAIFNVFSFTLLIPILNILFKTGENTQVYHFMEWGSGSLKEVAVNNFYYYVTQMIETHGPQMTLLFMGLFLAFMTMLKTSCYFGSSAIMIPLRTGVVRDIRVMVYSKVMHLPLGFFSEERKPGGGERRRNGGLRAGDVGKRERKPFSAGADADEHADGRRLLRHIGKIRFRVRPGERQLHRRAALNAERGEYTVGLAERKLFAEHDAAVPRHGKGRRGEQQ